MDSVKSTTFIKKPPFMSDIQKKFIYTKELLSGRIFLGYYQERRYVAVLNEYRDVVVISSEETELLQDLFKISQKWSGVTDVKWVGITGPESFIMPKVYCFWCKLSDLAFGCYWFQIRHVKLMDGEVILQVKHIRKSQAPLIAITPQSNQTRTSDERAEKGESSTSMCDDTKKTLLAFQESCVMKINSARSFLTWKNIVFTLKFIIAVIIAIIMGTISLVGQLGEFLLKLIREFTLLVNAFTPIVIQLIDFLTKVVGGLYILLAGMFVRNYNQPTPNPYKNSNLYSKPYQSALAPPHVLGLDWRERNQMLRQELLSGPAKRD